MPMPPAAPAARSLTRVPPWPRSRRTTPVARPAWRLGRRRAPPRAGPRRSSARSRTTWSQNGMPRTSPFRLRRRGQVPVCGERQGVVRDPADALPGEDSLLDRRLVGQPSVERPPSWLYSPSLFSRTMTRSMSGRFSPSAKGLVTPSKVVHVLAERASDRDQQAPEGDVVGYSWPAHSAEEDGVVLAQGLQTVGRHQRALGEVALARPVELDDPQVQVVEWSSVASTVCAEAATSVPMPSPGMSAICRPGVVVSTSRPSGRSRQGDELGLQELLDAHVTALAAESGMLHTSERRRGVGDDALVEADHAGLPTAR